MNNINVEAKYLVYVKVEDMNVNGRQLYLTDDRGNILFICPYCDQSFPNIFKGRCGLLTLLRQVHHKEVVTPIT